MNDIAQEVNYIPPGDDLSIPEGANGFINYALDENPPEEISTTQRQTINIINERKNRLTENNLILSSGFSFINDERTNLFDEDFSIFRFKLELAGNLLASASKLLGLPKDDNGRYELFNVAYSQYTKVELDYIKHLYNLCMDKLSKILNILIWVKKMFWLSEALPVLLFPMATRLTFPLRKVSLQEAPMIIVPGQRIA